MHVSRLLPLEGESWGEAYPEPRARKTVERPDEPEMQEEEDGDVHFETVGPTLTGIGEGEARPSEGPLDASAVPEGGDMGLTPRMVSTPEPGLVPAVPRSVRGAAVPATGTSLEPLTYKDGMPVYYVEKFHEAKVVDRLKHFLVEWQGFPDRSQFTWEPRRRLREDVPDLVRMFEREERARRRDTGWLP